MDLKKIAQSHTFKLALHIIGVLLVLLFVFRAGMFVGFRKAAFSNKIGESYFRQMSGHRDDPIMGINRGDFVNAHGAIGQIIEIHGSTFTIEDRDSVDETVTVSTSTVIKDLSET